MSYALVSVLSLVTAVLAGSVVSPKTLDSDISILIHNDLTENASPFAGSGVLVLDPMPLHRARRSCEDLGESLWDSSMGSDRIQTQLDYLLSQKTYHQGQRFWVSSTDCAPLSINSAGEVAEAEADERLPVLCTQTAPYSTLKYNDTAPKWQVSVRSNDEQITGFRDRKSFRFLGLRYAEKAKRWSYSKLYKGQLGQVSALEYGSICAQGTQGSEDCFFLNVWTPYLPRSRAYSRDRLKPVMFWIHGGAFTGGSGSDPVFDGGNLASRGDVVVVTINYRLGTLGFLALDDGTTNGNYGLADQITALDWVRRNIKDFGGDPNRITIFGQSAGAGSVRALLASSEARGKFAAAIMESNLGGLAYGTTYSMYYTIEEEMAVAGSDILRETNCTNATSKLDCLRDIPAMNITSLNTTARYLVVDGKYLTSTELNLTDGASTASVPLLLGTMRDDGAAFIGYPDKGETLSKFLRESGLPSEVAPSQLFPQPSGSNQTLDIFNTTARIATDGIFRCVDQATAYAGVSNHIFPEVYFYEFNRSYQMHDYSPNPPLCEAPITPGYPHGDPNQEYFKCHSGELFYVFGNLIRMGYPLRDEYDLPFAQYVLDTWASFARTFNPNPDLSYTKTRGYTNTTHQVEMAGTWTRFKDGDSQLRRLQWPASMVKLDDTDQCRALSLPLDYYK
ncbi:Carboxylic ester hydrolase [Penicillium ucsense]|uniref:Carboxylic ester hydrolase n=1 Tax=Penicillium ucsense TaxID=2839758 RepID=A0A8J8WBB4_9EURO|nr:Carboxylic ester hydrolase [Penicillium ucsense]KAF7733205.1 Carboxylic ester hydrolase [Penicillium ucsense]